MLNFQQVPEILGLPYSSGVYVTEKTGYQSPDFQRPSIGMKHRREASSLGVIIINSLKWKFHLSIACTEAREPLLFWEEFFVHVQELSCRWHTINLCVWSLKTLFYPLFSDYVFFAYQWSCVCPYISSQISSDYLHNVLSAFCMIRTSVQYNIPMLEQTCYRYK